MQPRFYYLRHGESDWNVEERCIGSLDPLTERGIGQAHAAINAIRPLGIVAVFHSPLIRAADTAKIIAGGADRSLHMEPLLREACLGVKEGAREDDPLDPFELNWRMGSHIEGAETFEALDVVSKKVVHTLPWCEAVDA